MDTVVTNWSWLENFANQTPERLNKYNKLNSLLSKKPEWNQAIKSFEHQHLYKLTIKDVHQVLDTSEDALRNINKSDSFYQDIHNMSTKYPMMYVFHLIMEKKKKVPTWKEVRDYIIRDDPSLIWNDFCIMQNIHPLESLRNHDVAALKALFWRLGMAYYSWVREVDLLVYLRQVGKIDVKYHVLMDVYWKADLYVENVNTMIELYIRNPMFKNEDNGRKLKCKKMNPQENVIEFPIESKKLRSQGDRMWIVKGYDKKNIIYQIEQMSKNS